MGQEFSLHATGAVTNPPPAGGANGDVVSDPDLENPDMNTVHGTLHVWNQELENLHETLEAWSAEFDEVRQTFEVWSLQFDRLITTLGYERRNGLIIASATPPTNTPITPGLTNQDNQIHAILNDDNGAILNSDSSQEFMEQTASVSHGMNPTLDAEISSSLSLSDLGLNETAQLELNNSPPIDSSLTAQDSLQVIVQPGTPITWPNAQDAPSRADPPSSGTEGDENTSQPEQETDNSLKRRAESDPASAASVGILIPVKKTAAPAPTPGNEEPAPERKAIAPEVEGTEGSEDGVVIVNSTDEVVNNIEPDPATTTTPVSSG